MKNTDVCLSLKIQKFSNYKKYYSLKMSQTNVNLERNQPVYLLDKNYYQVLVYDPDKKEDVLVTFGDQYAPKVTELILEGNPDVMESRDQYLKEHKREDNPTKPEFWSQRYIFLS